jgi:hypothetical protein
VEEARNKCIIEGTEFDITKLPTKEKLQDHLREFFTGLGTERPDVGEGRSLLR